MVKTVYAADAFLTFHHTNAYEKDGQLVVDLATMKDGEVSSTEVRDQCEASYSHAKSCFELRPEHTNGMGPC